MEWLEQLTQVMTTVQQQLAAAERQHATVEWPDQMTQVTATVQLLPAAKRHLVAVE